MKRTFALLFSFILFACTQKEVEINSIGDQTISIFENVNLNFDMKYKDSAYVAPDSILRLDAGRVILKKIKLPDYQLRTNVEVELTLTSNGDPWDKSGSVFVIPADSDLSLLDFENGNFNLKDLNEPYPAVTPFDIKGNNYQPNIELLRFMTPFGVGYFSTDSIRQISKPVYIPNWEDSVTWKQGVTHLITELKNEVYVGIYIDTWTNEGYNIDLKLNYKESDLVVKEALQKDVKVLSLVNNIKYAANQAHFDGFFEGNAIEVDFELDSIAENAKLYYTTTGHGGHSSGDEFTKKENIISLDKSVVKRFIPWRDDCASFRRFNPSSGVWFEKTTWRGKEIEERIASSDLSRSNWCPGSKVVPEIIELDELSKGKHTIGITIPQAQKAEGNEQNYWMVSCYLVYE